MINLKYLFTSVLAFACIVHPVHAQPEAVELESKSYWPGFEGGMVRDVEVVANLLFLIDPAGLSVIDVSDPNHLDRVGSMDGIGSYDDDIRVVDNLAYVLGDTNLTVVNVSDPFHPVRVGGVDIMGIAGTLDVAGNYIYVADGEAGLAIIKIIFPELNPTAALQDLILAIDESSLPDRRQRPMQAGLAAALASVEREQINAAVNQLRAFQNKARAQVA